MQFFSWTTDYQHYKRQIPKRDQEPYDAFMKYRRREQEMAGIPTHRLFAEHIWAHQDGSPYYNIHPNLVSRLCKVDMSKIPSTLLKMPHELRAVNIRFAKQHEEFTLHEDQHTDFRAKLSNTSGQAPPGSFIHSILMVNLIEREQRLVLFIMDFNVFTPLKQPVYSLFTIMPEEDCSLEEVLHRARNKNRSPSYVVMLENVMRLCVSIGFLADNPTICEPDILVSDRVAYQNADAERRSVLVAQAKKRGKNGYNIGTDIMFLGERPVMSHGNRGELTGRELEYSHIRMGHPHLVRYGEAKKLVKMMWYVPTHVRPDKPFKPS